MELSYQTLKLTHQAREAESVNNTQVESADFGLNISKIHKDGTEEKAHPRRVSGTLGSRMERGVCLKREKKAHDVCRTCKRKQKY
uniref:Katanin catalytic subunit A1 like 2 n=1 Tax=Peromyscus maniculatus bairdii TaxID=230844 RepID=A0A8C8W6W9_PERMB